MPNKTDFWIILLIAWKIQKFHVFNSCYSICIYFPNTKPEPFFCYSTYKSFSSSNIFWNSTYNWIRIIFLYKSVFKISSRDIYVVKKLIECKVSLFNATTVGKLHARNKQKIRREHPELEWWCLCVCRSLEYLDCVHGLKSVGSFTRGVRAPAGNLMFSERPRPAGDPLRGTGPVTPMETKSRLKVTARRGPGLPHLPAQSNARVRTRPYPIQLPAQCTRDADK